MLTLHQVGSGENQNPTGNVNNMKIKAADDSPNGNQTEKEDDSKVSMGGREPSGSVVSVPIHTALGTWVRKKKYGKAYPFGES